MMGTHEGEATGADAFAAWAACSLDDCRDPETGFVEVELIRLADEAERFAREVRAFVDAGEPIREPVVERCAVCDGAPVSSHPRGIPRCSECRLMVEDVERARAEATIEDEYLDAYLAALATTYEDTAQRHAAIGAAWGVRCAKMREVTA